MENEPLKNFVRASDRAFDYDQPFKANLEFEADNTDWTLLTDGVIEFDLVRDNNDILIKAVLVYKAFDPETVLVEPKERRRFESFISEKLNASYNRCIPKGVGGGWAEKFSDELRCYSSEKVEFIQVHENRTFL